ncbi:interleukin-12 receptor subunit beta-2-like [Antedon mediterranea]|uniref:interleukin-12 receptor subunit beta-2-like n=1 Tax=Antedon mediterranea TaxID=105859 RepID=UPI003AF4338D
MNWNKPFGVALLINLLDHVILLETQNLIPSANNLTCFGYNCEHYVCTWVPGDITIEYVARWRDEQNWNFWHNCRHNTSNACEFYGEIINYRIVAVQPKAYVGTTNSIVEIRLDFDNIIPLPPRNLSIVSTAETLDAEWIDSPGFILNNQLNFILRYRQNDSQYWSSTPEEETHYYEIEGLIPFTLYEVQLRARYHANDGVYGNWTSPVLVKTKEGNPSGLVPVLPKLEYNKNTLRDVLISWMELPLNNRRGILLGYNIQLESVEASQQFQVPANQTSLLIPGLKRNINYTAYISAYNAIGSTEPSIVVIPTSEDIAQSVSLYVYAITLACVTVVFLLSCVCWVKIKKFKSHMEPLPEPHFFKLEIPDNQPTFKPLCEKEIFDELKVKKPAGHSESHVLLEQGEESDCKQSNVISTYAIVKEL